MIALAVLLGLWGVGFGLYKGLTYLVEAMKEDMK